MSVVPDPENTESTDFFDAVNKSVTDTNVDTELSDTANATGSDTLGSDNDTASSPALFTTVTETDGPDYASLDASSSDTHDPNIRSNIRLTISDMSKKIIDQCLNNIAQSSHPYFPKETAAYILYEINKELLIERKKLFAENDKDFAKFYSPVFKAQRTLTPNQLAMIIIRQHHVVSLETISNSHSSEFNLLGIYQEDPDCTHESPCHCGTYNTDASYARSVIREYDAMSFSVKNMDEIAALMKDLAPKRTINQQRDLIAVNNGLFHYDTKTLSTFDPEHIFLTKSATNYNPHATNPVLVHPEDGSSWDVESWVADFFNDDQMTELLWQIIGAVIRPHVRWNKSAWFYSDKGNNGKGTLCHLMRNLVGMGACATIPLSDFGKEFALEPLVRSSAIIVDENDVGTIIDKAANLKAVVTNDVLSINRKYRDPITYQFWGFMVQCLNDEPRIRDKTNSFYRRQIFIKFTKKFTSQTERTYIKNDYLSRRDVLEYVLYKVLHTDYYKFIEPPQVQFALDEFKISNDPVREFWQEFESRFVWDMLPFPFLYDLYRSWFQNASPSGSPLSSRNFVKSLVAIVEEGDTWFCEDRTRTFRPDKSMKLPEMLIYEYDLKNWKNKNYNGNDKNLICQTTLAPNYRGLKRIDPQFVAPVNTIDTDDEPTEKP